MRILKSFWKTFVICQLIGASLMLAINGSTDSSVTTHFVVFLAATAVIFSRGSSDA